MTLYVYKINIFIEISDQNLMLPRTRNTVVTCILFLNHSILLQSRFRSEGDDKKLNFLYLVRSGKTFHVVKNLLQHSVKESRHFVH